MANASGDIEVFIRRNARCRRPMGGGWPLRYAVRRFGWHVLDHPWEIEDKRASHDGRRAACVSRGRSKHHDNTRGFQP
jgi:hypothetical protein